MGTSAEVAKYLLQSKAIKLEPSNPFTWASGWLSPIYCDNRKTLGFPEIRSAIRDAFVQLIRERFPSVDTIAGVATGAIAQGALVADRMQLPFVYVRSANKTHGMGNRIEGRMEPGAKVVVVEDLVSTGGSSLSATAALREAGAEVLGMTAIFTYQFPVAAAHFAEAGVSLYTLTDYGTLIGEALSEGYIRQEDVEMLKAWRQSPETWNGRA
ncbi:MAG: orotate phosphoribosyltransferase [Bacteroidales bacterium]|nr:orotate phosphoribosyltransferase [Bacteroidales bacterium]MBQ7214093.1 orotate phosphoribosyltransferase [Bacteroidales bacterium]MBR3286362.1 orotate phosphoribosyltransferase [Bacteroidales bacterium]MCR5713836.1 orotate phosphoribosyltransferase [Bacteroidales bacterium]